MRCVLDTLSRVVIDFKVERLNDSEKAQQQILLLKALFVCFKKIFFKTAMIKKRFKKCIMKEFLCILIIVFQSLFVRLAASRCGWTALIEGKALQSLLTYLNVTENDSKEAQRYKLYYSGKVI